MKEQLKKYRWYIISYVLYFFIVLAISIENDLRRDFWPVILLFCIIIPLALYIFVYLFITYYKKKKFTLLPQTRTWSLVDFAKKYGKMQINVQTDGLGNVYIENCRFVNSQGAETLVCISHPLKDKNRQWISENKDSLIIKILESGAYCLCKEWDNVDL